MSENHLNDPFLAPEPGTPRRQETAHWQQTAQWQGTPVPLQPTMSPLRPGQIPPPPGYVPPPPMPQNPAYGTAAYPPPPPAGYMYAANYGATNYSAADTSKNWMGITSLILSLATVVVGFTCIPGIIFGHMGLSAAKRGEANNKGLALAGVIIGWVFLGLGLLFIGLMVLVTVADTSPGY